MNSQIQNIIYDAGLVIFITALTFLTVGYLTIIVKQISKK
jgi:hypothetical protein